MRPFHFGFPSFYFRPVVIVCGQHQRWFTRWWQRSKTRLILLTFTSCNLSFTYFTDPKFKTDTKRKLRSRKADKREETHLHLELKVLVLPLPAEDVTGNANFNRFLEAGGARPERMRDQILQGNVKKGQKKSRQ